ncbi:hypothetical protein [Phytohabitans rumicis]|uniref:GGDEF domain-containing protein n=1 Tax=Phytohabitans rumicis TaxID=1076125 RepID=A0A6V8LEC3_9ACTN|nr:hypothetical protein [Phytohabitans rumicis]GFJ93308.1 hypothetical protein Prum_069500 [Phytohabitans rumicis]
MPPGCLPARHRRPPRSRHPIDCPARPARRRRVRHPRPDTGPNELAAAITATLAEPGIPIGELLPQASVGVAAGSGDARYTLAQADAALHTAKRSGHPVLVYAPERDGIPNRDGSRPPLRRRDQRSGTDPLASTPATAAVQAGLVCSETDMATILRAVRTAHDWWALVLEATSTGTGAQPPTPTAQTAQEHMAQYADLAARIAPILNPDRQ